MLQDNINGINCRYRQLCDTLTNEITTPIANCENLILQSKELQFTARTNRLPCLVTYGITKTKPFRYTQCNQFFSVLFLIDVMPKYVIFSKTETNLVFQFYMICNSVTLAYKLNNSRAFHVCTVAPTMPSAIVVQSYSYHANRLRYEY